MRKLEAVEKADEGGKSWKRRGYAFVLYSLTSYLIEFKRRMRTRQHILSYFIIRQLNRMGKIIENSKENNNKPQWVLVMPRSTNPGFGSTGIRSGIPFFNKVGRKGRLAVRRRTTSHVQQSNY